MVLRSASPKKGENIPPNQKFVNHPLLKPDTLTYRKYQVDIFTTCAKRDCLVVIPTGLGKTIIALLLTIQQLRSEDAKVVFLAPTRPLVEQHMRTFQELLNIDPDALVMMTGKFTPEKREQIYKELITKVLFLTPQILQNDLIAGRIDLKNVSLMIFDEAHRATGDYAYTFLAKKYLQEARSPKILAITASPGKNREKIQEIMSNLHLNAVEIRTEQDTDVKPYIHDVVVEWRNVDLLPEMVEILKNIEKMQKIIYKDLKKLNLLDSEDVSRITRRDLLLAGQTLDQMIDRANPGTDLMELLIAKKSFANAVRLSHMAELLEAQGINAFYKFIQKNLEEIEHGKGTKSGRELFADPIMQEIVEKINQLRLKNLEHPKLGILMAILLDQFREHPNSHILIFCHFRDTIEYVVQQVNLNPLIKAKKFIGQQKKEGKGLSQKDQLSILEEFKEGSINTLIATSVAEEGLDIAECDMVIFYDVVPSEIRTIQRRGRTGRRRAGKVIILKTKGTREEGYYWAEKRREREMRQVLNTLKSDLNTITPSSTVTSPGYKDLTSFLQNSATDNKQELVVIEERSSHQEQSQMGKQDSQESTDISIDRSNHETAGEPAEKIRDALNNLQNIHDTDGEEGIDRPLILIDSRETASPITRELSELNARISLQKLPIGDYIISERVGIERKAIPDLVASIKDGRLFSELIRLKNQFSIPVLILEGNLKSALNVNRHALFGALSSIILKLNIFLYQANTPEETAEFIFTIAKKEQLGSEKKSITLRFKKNLNKISDQLEYILSGIPGINTARAQDLLKEFHTLEKVFTASEAELQQTSNIGPVLAKTIHKLAQANYSQDENDSLPPSK